MRRVSRSVLPLLLLFLACGSEPHAPDGSLLTTYNGSLSDYRGEGVLLVVTWADWASAWPLLREEIAQYRQTADPRVDFQFVNVDEHPEVARQVASDIVPSIIVVRSGTVIETLPNLTSAQQLRRLELEWLVT